ncbi:MAG TPA: hypothetical protein VF794_36705 [Archangium sp.]|jgi:hypothetical protein|uniref:hypothetical protein n=1 Tax=Archangium sp. TaxID=1872627 RepID=UPI002ED7FF4E
MPSRSLLLAALGLSLVACQTAAPAVLPVPEEAASPVVQAPSQEDRIRVLTVDGTPFAPGKTVRVEATVWAWAGSPTSDKLDLYFTADANNPSWRYLTTLTPTVGGEETLSATYVLPVGKVQAVRARFRYGGSVAACTLGDSYDDQDDLVFAVQ